MPGTPTREAVIGVFQNGRSNQDDFLQLKSAVGGQIFGWIDYLGTLQGSLAGGAGANPGGINGSVQFNNSNVFGGDSNFTYSSGAVAITAGLDTTIPLSLSGHSATQSATIFDVNNNAIGTASGFPVTIRGTGAGSPSWSAGGGHGLVQILTEDATAVGLVVMNRSQAGSNGVHPGVALYVDGNGVPTVAGGNATGDGSGNYSVLQFHANPTAFGAANAPGGLAVFLSTAGNGTVPLTLYQPIGGAGPGPNNSFQICRGNVLGFPLVGFDSGGAPGSPATNINLFFNGATSGTAKIGVASVAGTPNTLLLPTSTGAANQFLVTDGNNPQQLSWQSTLNANRVFYNKGTAYSGADAAIVLGAGWGTGAAVSAASGTDQALIFTVTAGTTPSANPTLVITFKDGAWANAPLSIAAQNGGSGNFAVVQCSTSTTTNTLTWRGTPVNASTYIITVFLRGI